MCEVEIFENEKSRTRYTLYETYFNDSVVMENESFTCGGWTIESSMKLPAEVFEEVEEC